MSVAEEKPAVDAILQKVMEAVPFQLTTDGGDGMRYTDAVARGMNALRKALHPA